MQPSEKKKKHGLVGNRNAVKRSNNTRLVVRCTEEDKKRWNKVAEGPLSVWVIEQLNAAVMREDQHSADDEASASAK